MKKLIALLLVCVCASLAAADLTLDEVLAKMQAKQAGIKDMYAETVTTITSNMSLPGAKDKGPQTMVQKGKMWTKGEGKSKIEMLSPMKQTTITNGDKMAIINAETGQKMVQDLKKLRGQVAGGKGQGEMSLDKAKEFFELSVLRTVNPDVGIGASSGQYVITGTPKKDNKFLGKMEFYVDSERWVPVKIVMFDAKGKPISQSGIEYKEVAGVNVPVKNLSNITTPMGAMKVEMEYTNVKVNQGISDSEFKVD